MPNPPTIWTVHMGRHVGDRPIADGYVAIGSADLGDPLQLPPTREAVKQWMLKANPDTPERRVLVWAAQMYRYLNEMRDGDLVIYPSKADRMVNIGRFIGAPTYHAGDPDTYPVRRRVAWLAQRPRDTFSQGFLNEIGSALTLFQVKTHRAEALAAIGEAGPAAPPSADPADPVDDDTALAAVSKQAEERTEDFVIRRLMSGLTGHEFEYFVAHLLEAMGYTARVTQASGDGGVDVIAHTDALGFQPPIIKVQCKRKTDSIAEADVNQLLGTLGEGEFGLFITLGSYSRSARILERNRAKLRLIDGEELVAMTLARYTSLAPRYRSLLPLKQVYVPDLGEG
jgi:restriction system protein